LGRGGDAIAMLAGGELATADAARCMLADAHRAPPIRSSSCMPETCASLGRAIRDGPVYGVPDAGVALAMIDSSRNIHDSHIWPPMAPATRWMTGPSHACRRPTHTGFAGAGCGA